MPDDGSYTPLPFEGQVAVQRHQNAANYLYVDGVYRISWNLVKPQIDECGWRFVNPAGHKTMKSKLILTVLAIVMMIENAQAQHGHLKWEPPGATGGDAQAGHFCLVLPCPPIGEALDAHKLALEIRDATATTSSSFRRPRGR